jgi:hypothetical protein
MIKAIRNWAAAAAGAGAPAAAGLECQELKKRACDTLMRSVVL